MNKDLVNSESSSGSSSRVEIDLRSSIMWFFVVSRYIPNFVCKQCNGANLCTQCKLVVLNLFHDSSAVSVPALSVYRAWAPIIASASYVLGISSVPGGRTESEFVVSPSGGVDPGGRTSRFVATPSGNQYLKISRSFRIGVGSPSPDGMSP